MHNYNHVSITSLSEKWLYQWTTQWSNSRNRFGWLLFSYNCWCRINISVHLLVKQKETQAKYQPREWSAVQQCHLWRSTRFWCPWYEPQCIHSGGATGLCETSINECQEPRYKFSTWIQGKSRESSLVAAGIITAWVHFTQLLFTGLQFSEPNYYSVAGKSTTATMTVSTPDTTGLWGLHCDIGHKLVYQLACSAHWMAEDHYLVAVTLILLIVKCYVVWVVPWCRKTSLLLSELKSIVVQVLYIASGEEW